MPQPSPSAFPAWDLAQSSKDGFFDAQGAPADGAWDEILAPHIEDRKAFALEITGDRYEPVYRDGDLIVVSPGASIRRGDRVLIKQHNDGIMICQLIRESARRIELAQLGRSSSPTSLQNKDVDWMSRHYLGEPVKPASRPFCVRLPEFVPPARKAWLHHGATRPNGDRTWQEVLM